MHYNELRERVAYYKKEMEGIEDMSGKFEEIMQRKINEARTEILEEGRLEGRIEGEANGLQKGWSEGRQEVARSMVRDGSIPLSKIAEFSGLTLNEVESIRNSINA